MPIFSIFGSLVKLIKIKNCHSSTTNDFDVKLGAVTKVDQRNTTTSKKIDDEVASANYDFIFIFTYYG